MSVVDAKSTSEEDINSAVYEAIEKAQFRPRDSAKTVVLKVNLRYYWDFSTGETTDPRVGSAIIDYFREIYDQKAKIIIAEADASAMRTKYAFRMLGYEDLAREKSVELMNLCDCKKVDLEVTVNGKKFDLPVAEPMLDADVLLNVPKLRTHRLTEISCSLKNLFGAIAVPRKIVYHPNLDEAIVAINKLLKPHLTVIDGIIALGKQPVKMNLVLASKDQLAIDYIAAKIMGYDPNRIRHL